MIKIIEYYYYAFVVLASIGVVFLIDDGEFDVYTFLTLVAFYAGLYLIIEQKKK